MILFWRHGHDDNHQDPKHRDDHELTDSKKTRKVIKKAVKDAINKYGWPCQILCSPMRRGIATAKIMKRIIEKQDSTKTVRILVTRKLSRYFCAKEQASPKVASETKRRKIPIVESSEELQARVDAHLESVKPFAANSKQPTWCITHAVLLKRIYTLAGDPQAFFPSSNIPFVHYFPASANFIMQASATAPPVQQDDPTATTKAQQPTHHHHHRHHKRAHHKSKHSKS
jgi:broad specificity phosphatase PhoE